MTEAKRCVVGPAGTLPLRDFSQDPTRSLGAAVRARMDAQDAQAHARTPEERAVADRMAMDAQVARDILHTMSE